MSKIREAFLVLFLPLTIFACHRVSSENQNNRKVYQFIPYVFGNVFYCIPSEDFNPGQMTLTEKGFSISKKVFSRSDALLGEGGLIDRVRFFSGEGRIGLDWNIPKTHGYYLRVLRCSDIFNRSKNIRGFSVYARSS